MAFDILYATNDAQVHRHSSLDQFKDGFLSAWVKNGWAPIVFDQIDGIGECSGIKSHPVAISFGDDLGYVFPEGKCVYFSDHFITVDKNGVEYKQLPECFGGNGELYPTFVSSNAFLNFDNDSGLGVHQAKALRVGLDYVKADETLPAVK